VKNDIGEPETGVKKRLGGETEKCPATRNDPIRQITVTRYGGGGFRISKLVLAWGKGGKTKIRERIVGGSIIWTKAAHNPELKEDGHDRVV